MLKHELRSNPLHNLCAANIKQLEVVLLPTVPHFLTLAVGALLRALANSLRALSYSLFSDSSLTAASQISSLFGFA